MPFLKGFGGGFKDDKKHNFIPLAWSSICTPNNMGRFRLRSMMSQNRDLLAKLGWRILKMFFGSKA
jgi:hypothetical protein